jgi:hypothetical protein
MIEVEENFYFEPEEGTFTEVIGALDHNRCQLFNLTEAYARRPSGSLIDSIDQASNNLETALTNAVDIILGDTDLNREERIRMVSSLYSEELDRCVCHFHNLSSGRPIFAEPELGENSIAKSMEQYVTEALQDIEEVDARDVIVEAYMRGLNKDLAALFERRRVYPAKPNDSLPRNTGKSPVELVKVSMAVAVGVIAAIELNRRRK